MGIAIYALGISWMSLNVQMNVTLGESRRQPMIKAAKARGLI